MNESRVVISAFVSPNGRDWAWVGDFATCAAARNALSVYRVNGWRTSTKTVARSPSNELREPALQVIHIPEPEEDAP